MVVARGSGCWVSESRQEYDMDYSPEVDYVFEVDQSGRGYLRVGDRYLLSRDLSIDWSLEVGEVLETILRAVRNADGDSWTIRALWLLDRVEPVRIGIRPTPTPTPVPVRFGGILRVVFHSGVDSLDPVFTGAYMTAAVSSHIFETPLGWNSRLETKPRMVDSWELGPDGLTYTFHLRDWLRFHNGDGVEAVDMVASLERWLDGVGAHAGLLREFIDQDNPFSVLDSDTFTVNLHEPYGQVPSAFARPYGGPVILPEEIAGSRAASESLAVEDLIGSGAYRFSEWELDWGLGANAIAVERFDGYVAAVGPPDLYVGGTIGYLDRISWLEIPDEEIRYAGLETGEWDVVDGVGSFYFAHVFQRHTDYPDIAVPLYRPGHRSWYQLIPSHPPFDDLKVRRAALFGTDVEEVMHSLGSAELWDLCPAIYYCGTPLETDAGGDEWYARFDLERARRLLEESTYAGETIVVLNPTDRHTNTPTNDVIRRQFEEVGFNIELPELDWATVVAQMNEPESFELSVGWHSHWCCGDPISDTSGAGKSPLWPKIPYVTKLRLDWAQETDPAKKAAILDRYQTALFENVYNVYLGVFYPVFPHTSDLEDFEVKAIPFYSNSWLSGDELAACSCSGGGVRLVRLHLI